jgi:hypothetical protein
MEENLKALWNVNFSHQSKIVAKLSIIDSLDLSIICLVGVVVTGG